MDFQFISFIAFATIAIFGSTMVIFKRDPVASAFSLVLVLFSFAGIYALMNAHLVAVLQILVYTGAIMVLFVFVIMLLNSDIAESDLEQSGVIFKLLVTLGLVALGVVLLKSISEVGHVTPTGELTDERIASLGGNVQVMSEKLFTDFVFHFELVSFLVLGAIVSTIALAKRKSKSSLEDSST